MKTQRAVCGEFKSTWGLKYLPSYDVWICKKHTKREIERRLKKEEEPDCCPRCGSEGIAMDDGEMDLDTVEWLTRNVDSFRRFFWSWKSKGVIWASGI